MSSHVHIFDPLSGWCIGCTIRDDGRRLWLGDDIKPTTTTDEDTRA